MQEILLRALCRTKVELTDEESNKRGSWVYEKQKPAILQASHSRM
jgi:hypothetical protein